MAEYVDGMVSIVIPIVRNDRYIEECVAHIEKSTYRNFEIIIVDEGRERSYQRNFGIKKAKGEFLIWLDSDMMIQPDLLEDCVAKMNSVFPGKNGYERPLAIYIPERISTPGWFGRLRDWERQFYNGTLVDVVRFLRTENCPLFDETLHGVEDSDWERQLRKNKPDGIFITSSSYFNHHDKIGLWKYLKKKAYYARCLNQYRRKNPDDRLLTLKYRCFDVFLQDGKWKRFLSRPHMALAVWTLIFARGVIMITQSLRYK